VAGCKEWSRAAAGLPRVTARVACSGTRLGSVKMSVVVLRIRSELRTTAGDKQGDDETQIIASGKEP